MGKVLSNANFVSTLLDNNSYVRNVTTATTDSTNSETPTILSDVTEQLSSEETDDDDKNFAAENAPSPPPKEHLHNGAGTYRRERSEFAWEPAGASNRAANTPPYHMTEINVRPPHIGPEPPWPTQNTETTANTRTDAK